MHCNQFHVRCCPTLYVLSNAFCAAYPWYGHPLAVPPPPLRLPPQSSRTVHREGYRPDKGAWVQYGECCYTANGSKAWSHDVVYAQNELLEAAVGTKDEPTAEIMDVIQGSGKKQSGEATKLRQAKHESSKALFAIQLIEDLRIQKLKVRVGSSGNMVEPVGTG